MTMYIWWLDGTILCIEKIINVDTLEGGFLGITTENRDKYSLQIRAMKYYKVSPKD